MKLALSLLLLVFVASSKANISSTVTIASDYQFNGVSQTNEDPALQIGLDWDHEEGWYSGTWASNVDFGDGTKTEIDFYGGKAFQVNENLHVDLGIAAYTYHGDSLSDNLNYQDFYIKTAFHSFEINFSFADNYFGTGAKHGVITLAGHHNINESLLLTAGFDYSKSFDADKYRWETNDSDYLHWHITIGLDFKGVNFTAGVHDTDLDTFGERRFLITANRTFEF